MCVVAPITRPGLHCSHSLASLFTHPRQNGEVTGGVIELESPAVGVVKAGKNIVVGSMDKSFHSYHIKVRYAVFLCCLARATYVIKSVGCCLYWLDGVT